MEIRKIRKTDLPSLAAINSSLYRHTTKGQSLLALKNSFKNRIEGACLVAQDGKELAGAIFAEKKITFTPNSGYIYSIFVSKKWQGRGLGKLLLKQCLEAAKKKGITNISILFDEKNNVAARLYKNAGFKPFRLMYLKKFNKPKALS